MTKAGLVPGVWVLLFPLGMIVDENKAKQQKSNKAN